ncbi:hypothetical protein V8E36_004307 [Tilletia maclaganii]
MMSGSAGRGWRAAATALVDAVAATRTTAAAGRGTRTAGGAGRASGSAGTFSYARKRPRYSTTPEAAAATATSVLNVAGCIRCSVRASSSAAAVSQLAPASRDSEGTDPGKNPEAERRARRARAEAMKVYSRIFRFRTRNMKAITPAGFYKLFLEQCPYNEESEAWHPELWARLLRMAYRRNHSGLVRIIAADALKWTECPAAQAFTKARSGEATEVRAVQTASGEGPIPTTTKSLKLFIRNIVHADQIEREKRALKMHLGLSKNDDVRPTWTSLSLRESRTRASDLLKRTESAGSDLQSRIQADRFAWAERLRHGSMMSCFKAPAAPEFDLYKPRRDHVAKRYRQKHADTLGDSAGKPERPTDSAELLEPFDRQLERLQRHDEQLPELLDRYRTWATFAKDGKRQNLMTVLRFISGRPESTGAAATSADSSPSAPEDNILFPFDTEPPRMQTEFGQIDPKSRTYPPPDRPPTHLLLMALRHLVLMKDPKRALALAQLYLELLLLDTKAGYADHTLCFTFHSAIEEVAEPRIVDGQLSGSIPTLFLRTAGPTYAVSEHMQPPRGHEILNAVLRAHLRAGNPIEDMFASMRILCGIRSGRMVRLWEKERRMEKGRMHALARAGLKLNEAPIGFMREAASAGFTWTSPKSNELEENVDATADSKAAVTVSEAKESPTLTAAAFDLSLRQHRMLRQFEPVEQILCFPNEESILILLEAMRDHRDRLTDSIALVNAAMLIWGPPPIKPILVPTEFGPSPPSPAELRSERSSPRNAVERAISGARRDKAKVDTAPSSSSAGNVRRRDPYLRITTAAVRKLLRWACRERTQESALRVIQVGEACIRQSREWDAALQGLPVIAYDPRFTLSEPRGEPKGVEEEQEVGEQEKCLLKWLNAYRIPAADFVDAQAKPSQPRRTLRSKVVKNAERLPTTWMRLDGGSGYLTRAEAESSARHLWYGAIARVQSMGRGGDGGSGRGRVPGSALAEEEAEERAVLEEMPMEGLEDAVRSASAPTSRRGCGNAATRDAAGALADESERSPPGSGSEGWLTLGQGDVLAGRHHFRTRNVMVNAYESYVMGKGGRRPVPTPTGRGKQRSAGSA